MFKTALPTNAPLANKRGSTTPSASVPGRLACLHATVAPWDQVRLLRRAPQSFLLQKYFPCWHMVHWQRNSYESEHFRWQFTISPLAQIAAQGILQQPEEGALHSVLSRTGRSYPKLLGSLASAVAWLHSLKWLQSVSSLRLFSAVFFCNSFTFFLSSEPC